MIAAPFEPRIIAKIRKNARESYRIAVVHTDDGPRVNLTLVRHHDGKVVVLRCLGRFRPEILGDLAEGIRAAERLLSGEARL